MDLLMNIMNILKIVHMLLYLLNRWVWQEWGSWLHWVCETLYGEISILEQCTDKYWMSQNWSVRRYSCRNTTGLWKGFENIYINYWKKRANTLIFISFRNFWKIIRQMKGGIKSSAGRLMELALIKTSPIDFVKYTNTNN